MPLSIFTWDDFINIPERDCAHPSIYLLTLLIEGGSLMTTALSIKHPLFRQTVGFDRFNDLFETLAAEPKNSYPPYDIVKVSEDTYHITLAVAGFSEENIDITVEKDTLIISASHAQPKTDSESVDAESVYLHRGIAKRNFAQKFRLADHMKVTQADMQNGLLTVTLVREIPEEKKPQQIQINSLN